MRLRGQLGLGSSRTVAGGAFFELSAVFPGDLLRLGLWLDCVSRVRIGNWARELNSFSVALGDSAHLHRRQFSAYDQVDFCLELWGAEF